MINISLITKSFPFIKLYSFMKKNEGFSPIKCSNYFSSFSLKNKKIKKNNTRKISHLFCVQKYNLLEFD